MKLEGKISYLVPFDEHHLHSGDYMSWLRDYEVIKTINRLDYLTPVSFAEVKQYCETVMQSTSDIFMAINAKDKDIFIGTIRVSRLSWVTGIADVGILIGDKDYWGKGIATDAIATIGQHLFDRLGMRKLTAGLMDINPSMLRVFEKLGFQKEGVFRKHDLFEGAYVDHIHMGCFKEEFRSQNA